MSSKGALHNNTPPLKCATRNVVHRKVQILPFLPFFFLHSTSNMYLFSTIQKPKWFWQHNIAKKKWIKLLLGEINLAKCAATQKTWLLTRRALIIMGSDKDAKFTKILILERVCKRDIWKLRLSALKWYHSCGPMYCMEATTAVFLKRFYQLWCAPFQGAIFGSCQVFSARTKWTCMQARSVRASTQLILTAWNQLSRNLSWSWCDIMF